MVVDTSALVAILLGEPMADVIGPLVMQSEAIIAAPNVLEAHMVLRRHLGDDVHRVIATCLADLDVTVVTFGSEHAEAAALAFDRYGKGRHLASLNFGDCMAYALAKLSGQSLLYTGEDFAETDIPAALR